jgi:hypothetical protein
MKSLIVLIIDHDTFNEETPDADLTPAELFRIGKAVNDEQGHWNGYEGWMACYDVPHSFMAKLDKKNVDESVLYPFAVGLHSTGDIAPIARFATSEDASKFIGKLEGAESGRFYIDGPQEEAKS